MRQSRSSSKQLTTSRLRIAAGMRCSTFRSLSSHRRSAKLHSGRERQNRGEHSLLTNENPRPRPECSAAVAAFARSVMGNGEVAMMLAPVLTPHGVLTLRPSGDVARLEADLGARLEKAFAKGSGHGLLCLGADEVA